MRQAIARLLIGALLMVGIRVPVLADGLGVRHQSEWMTPDGQLSNSNEAAAPGPNAPTKPRGEPWWQRLLDHAEDWFGDRWQELKDWWAGLPNWAKGLIVGSIAALVVIAVVVGLMLAGVALAASAIVAVIGAVVGLIVGDLLYGLSEDGEFSVAKALGWALLGGVVGAAVFALLWAVFPTAWAYLARGLSAGWGYLARGLSATWKFILTIDEFVAFTGGRIVSTLRAWLTALVSPVATFLAPRLAPIAAWFNGFVTGGQRAVQPLINFIGPNWAALTVRLSPTTTAIGMRIQWLMGVTGISQVMDWVNTLFIRLGIWFAGFVEQAPRLILSTINGISSAVIYVATADTVRLDKLIESFLIGFFFTYLTMLPTHTVTFSEARMMREFLRESGVAKRYWEQTVQAFSQGAMVDTLPAGTVVYRYYGSGSQPRGNWVTLTPLKDPVNELALPPGNEALGLQKFIISRDTKVLSGVVAPNFGRPGGAMQIYLPDKNVLGEASP